jgi:hypothetical protein
MTRVLADLPEDDIRWLDARAAEQGKSRAAVLREAVAAYRADGSADWIERGFGAWKGRVGLGDAVAWQRRERDTWHGATPAPLSAAPDDSLRDYPDGGAKHER